MSKAPDPLKKTAQDLHRFWVTVYTEKQWYDLMRECRSWFGKNWQTMSKVRRKLNPNRYPRSAPVSVWFDVPDPKFATWISVKYSIQVQSNAKKESGK